MKEQQQQQQQQQQHQKNCKLYPFAALVGQEDLKTVLILNAIYPSIGGVLIRGEKGTAKSTAARGLARLLPLITITKGDPYNRPPDQVVEEEHVQDDEQVVIDNVPVPFVNLPIGATEDRVLGSLDFQAAIKTGKTVFHPGLLAAANRGILYIDEVNLLPAHLVDVLLDAAAMGVNTVQREGLTLSHPAQFWLIGTMNPEEGDLRPQLLDRFGLMVQVAAPRDPTLRMQVVQRRMAYEANPTAFCQQWQKEQDLLQRRIQQAQGRLPKVKLNDDMMHLICTICTQFHVDGMRADLCLHKTARALAAWEERETVTTDDIRRAAQWVLPHRQGRAPFEPPQLDSNKLNDTVQNHRSPPEPTDKNDEASHSNEAMQNDDNGGNIQDNDGGSGNEGGEEQFETFVASKPDLIKKLRLQSSQQHAQQAVPGGSGKRNSIQGGGAKRGQYTRSRPRECPTDLAVDATLRAAARNGVTAQGQPIIHPDNLRQKIRDSTADALILFVVDASGSMAARARMEAVKGAVLALLNDAYQQRDQVGVIAFRGTEANVLLAPTYSVKLAEKRLQDLPTGGRTPLAQALVVAHETLLRIQRNQPDQTILMVLLSDGKANVPLPESNESTTTDPWKQSLLAAAEVAKLSVPCLFLDTEMSYLKIGRGPELAEALQADYMPLDELTVDALVHPIRRRLV